MYLLDFFVVLLFGLKYIVYFLAVVLAISGLDDLFIDLTYWSRRAYRALFVYRKHDTHQYQVLNDIPEKPLAIMVPAWQEHGVVGPMAELAAMTLNYENYHIFVGTYPNDPQTQKEVDIVCARFPNVHKVVCARPGPTSKADCLNNITAAIFQFEKAAKFEFSGFILHDSEDVLSAMELKLFNFLVDRKDLIQLPVYPFATKWYDFTSGHYMDEFSEMHAKDVPAREALVGQVPSAGVGTCFSRRAIEILLKEGDGIAFDIKSLTEDYDIGIRLKAHGLNEIFVRYPVVTPEHAEKHSKWRGNSIRESSVICIREYFPDTFQTAVRQKSRWIIGIVFQGMKNHKWDKDWRMNYFLLRDRKGGVTNLIGFMASVVFLFLLVIWCLQQVLDTPYHFLSIYGDEIWLSVLLSINLMLLLNRVLQRFIFVRIYYGWKQGLLSIVRMAWGNVINFFANVRALRQVLEMGDARRVAWDKTTHAFPHVAESRARLTIGQTLVNNGAITDAALTDALKNKPIGLRLGRFLLSEELISAEQLAQAVAAQSEVDIQAFDPYKISDECAALITKEVAWRYQVVVIGYAQKSKMVHLASESYLSPVSLGAITRLLGHKVRYTIALPGQVTLALQNYYQPEALVDPRETCAAFNALSTEEQQAIWSQYEQSQWALLEIIMEHSNISQQVMNQMMIGYERCRLTIAEYFVERGILTKAGLLECIAIKETRQFDFTSLVADKQVGA